MSEKNYVISERPKGIHVVTVWLSDDECASMHLVGVEQDRLEFIAAQAASAIILAYKVGIDHGLSKRSRQFKDLLEID